MTVLDKVASGVKRHIPSHITSSSSLNLRSQDGPPPLAQAPDLRRWSNFMNPFPPVGPGGYTRYYKSCGDNLLQESSTCSTSNPLISQLSNLCQYSPSIIPPSPPTHSTASPKSPKLQAPTLPTAFPSPPTRPPRRAHHSRTDHRRQRNRKLSSIAESTSEAIAESQPPLAQPPSTTYSNRSLRRRKSRINLRLASIERDLSAQVEALSVSPTPQPNLDRSGSTSSSQSKSTQRTHTSSETSSSEGPHSFDSSIPSLQVSTESDMPLTPKDEDGDDVSMGVKSEAYDWLYLSKDHHTTLVHSNPKRWSGNRRVTPAIVVVEDFNDDDDDDYGDEIRDPFERPDSRSTYRTARSYFSEF